MRSIQLATALPLVMLAFTAHAVPIYVEGDGAAVSSVDRFASFDSLSIGDDLSAYSEDGVNVFVNDVHGVFDGSYFAAEGYDAGNITDSLYRVSAADGATFYGVEFLLQDWGYERTGWDTFVWETYFDGVLTGTGTFTTPEHDTIMGWFDVEGMDELRVGSMNGHNNGLWFDSLEMQTRTISEPGVLALIGMGLFGFGMARRQPKN